MGLRPFPLHPSFISQGLLLGTPYHYHHHHYYNYYKMLWESGVSCQLQPGECRLRRYSPRCCACRPERISVCVTPKVMCWLKRSCHQFSQPTVRYQCAAKDIWVDYLLHRPSRLFVWWTKNSQRFFKFVLFIRIENCSIEENNARARARPSFFFQCRAIWTCHNWRKWLVSSHRWPWTICRGRRWAATRSALGSPRWVREDADGVKRRQQRPQPPTTTTLYAASAITIRLAVSLWVRDSHLGSIK